MKLIFSALAIFTLVIVLLAGGGAFWVTSSAVNEVKQESIKSLATGINVSISSQMLLFAQTVEQIGKDAEVIAAIESNDPVLMEKTAEKMQSLLPNALRLRLLPASVDATEETHVPIMGYADLHMVKKTLLAKQSPIIQGEGVNRHLAITAQIKKDNQVIGVVLASLKFDFVSELLKKMAVKEDYLGINQSSVALGFTGSSSLQNGALETLAIDNSPWQILYSTSKATTQLANFMMIGLVTVLMLLTCVAQFFGYYYINSLLKKDQDKVLEAVKHLMTGKGLGAYKLHLSEMQVIISTLVQFKRILDNKSSNEERAEQEHVEMDDFNQLSEDDDELEHDFLKKKR